MKAAVYKKTNSPFVLLLSEVKKPVPTDSQVLVKIIAASLNAADYRSMGLNNIPENKIFGADIAGIVEAVGKDANKYAIGDEVFGDIMGCGWGGLAEYVAVPESVLASKPVGISFVDTASLPVAAITALQGLREAGGLQAGQRVLIYGAAGGVGSFAVQLAKYFGAEVTAVCSFGNMELVRSLGADRLIDYSGEDFTKTGECYHLIFAVNGKRPLAAYLRALVPGGRLIVAGGAYTQILDTLLWGPVLSLGGKKIKILVAKPCIHDLEFLAGLVEKGKLKPVIDKTYPLTEAPQAMHYLMQGHARGKVVITVA